MGNKTRFGVLWIAALAAGFALLGSGRPAFAGSRINIQGVSAGSVNLTDAPCPNVNICTSGNCFCMDFEGPFKGNGSLGNATISLQQEVDFNVGFIGNQFCTGSVAIGTITSSKGSIGISQSGTWCESFNLALTDLFFTDAGTFTFNGGAGKFAGASGAGTLNASTDAFVASCSGASIPCTLNGQISIEGSLQK